MIATQMLPNLNCNHMPQLPLHATGGRRVETRPTSAVVATWMQSRLQPRLQVYLQLCLQLLTLPRQKVVTPTPGLVVSTGCDRLRPEKEISDIIRALRQRITGGWHQSVLRIATLG
jgi:hypothetical protein